MGSGSSNAYGLASLSTLKEAAPAPDVFLDPSAAAAAAAEAVAAALAGEEKIDLGLADVGAEVEGLCDVDCCCCC